jgi:hypothetical protein
MKLTKTKLSVITVIFSSFFTTAETINTQQLLAKIVENGNKKTPIQLNPNLFMERFSSEGEELTYHYKSTYSDWKDFNLRRFVDDRTRELTQKVCTEKSQQIFRERKVKLNYEYLDKNDKLLAVIAIDAGDCN